MPGVDLRPRSQRVGVQKGRFLLFKHFDELGRRVDGLLEELVELVAVHEVRQVGSRLPERHRILVANGAEQCFRCDVLAHVRRGQPRLGPVLRHHRVPVFACPDALRARHDVAQRILHAALRLLDLLRLIRFAGGPLQRRAEARQLLPYVFHPGVVIAEEEPRRGQKVLVVLLVVDLCVGGVELVRRCGEQQRAHALAVVGLGTEQRLRQLHRGVAFRVAWIEQLLEALKLVEDDQVGLEGSDAHLGQEAPQLADHLIPA